MPEIFSSKKATPPTKLAPKPAVRKTTPGTHSRLNGALSAFMVKPDGIRFETQEEQEEILLLMRQHLITNLGWVLVATGLILLPLLLVPLIITSNVIPPDLPPGYFVILPVMWYVGVFGYIFTNFLHWYYNVYIVTNERVVDIDWLGLLYKRLSSTQLSNIQDVTYKQGGILDSFFDFGTVYIQTAGTDPNFEFESVPKPDHVVREINRIFESEK